MVGQTWTEHKAGDTRQVFDKETTAPSTNQF